MGPKDTVEEQGAERVFGSGEMAHLIRAFDWSTTPLGPISHWTAELVMAVNMMLSSNTITALFWGPKQFLLYNDLYRPHLGAKHPALGMTLRTAWGEVYELVEALFLTPLESGVATLAEKVSMQVLMDEGLVERVYSLTVIPVRAQSSEGSSVVGVYQTAVDHTHAVQTERKLQAIEAQATRVLDSIGEGVIVTDAKTCILRMNAIAEQLTGWTGEQALQTPLSEVYRIVDESTHEEVESPADRVLRLGTLSGLMGRTMLKAKDGREIAIDDSAAPIRNDAGEITGIVLVFRDISERRSAEREKESLTERLRQAMEATTDAVGAIDQNWMITYVNPRAEALYGKSKDVVGRNHWQLFPAIDYEGSEVRERYYDAMERGISSTFEFFYPEPLNIWISMEVLPTQDGIVLFSQDVTEHKEQEAERNRLFGERLRFKALVESSQDFIGMCDLEGKPFYGNPAALELLGFPSLKQFCQTNFIEFFFPEDRALIGTEFLPKVLRERSAQIEIRFCHQTSGEAVPMSYQVFLLENEQGQPFGFGTVSRNLTYEKQTTALLLQTEKLTAVGRLASSIAHEINNPLESVTNLLYLMRTNDNLEEVHEYVDTAERELRRISLITNQTLRFHKQSSHASAHFCYDLIGDSLAIYQGRIVNQHIHVEKRKRAQHPVLCLGGEIRQVLGNLIGNAIDSMPTGGQLTLRSREATDWRNNRRGVVITVADTGTGISPATQKKIFEAFFTTKGIGGTGLGLWVSNEIVARHEGYLRLRSCQEEGRSGTVFNLFLPFDAKPKEAESLNDRA